MLRYVSAGLIGLCLGLAACGGGDQTVDSPMADPTPVPTQQDSMLTPPPSATKAPGPLEAGDEIVTWVDRINVRAASNTAAKVVARIPNGEPMTYAGEQSSTKETLLLRSVAYREPWLKVTTKDGKEGWVFGGAVKRPTEQKGNDIITDTKLDFPYFGKYDLSKWKALNTAEESGGDAEATIRRYQDEGQIMVIRETDMGDYGYSIRYELMDVEKRVLLERELSFQADLDMLLTEKVINRIESPEVEYTRTEELSAHPVQLGGRPLLVNGAWTKKEL